MLILTRRPVESIHIGDEVTVTVLGVVGNQVRFGIEAPRHIVVDRAEIHERKKRAALAGSTPGNPEPQGTGSGSAAPARANGSPVPDAEEAIAGHDPDAPPSDGNVATSRLRR